VIGSGFMTHGLPFITREMMFDNAVPGMPYAHPTVDHYIPLFITVGAATDPAAPARTTVDGYMIGLSKRSFQVA
jgi:4,5-DOPA dioxygenase extradiol